MRKNFGSKNYLLPQPVLIVAAYGEDGVPCAMNAAWAGHSGAGEVTMCLGSGHKTVKNILERGAFTISIGTEDQALACDYVGVVSGNDNPKKLEKAGLHTEKSEFVDAPIILELPMALECKLKSYNSATGIMVGEIVNVSADEKVLDENGLVDPAKLKPIVFDAINMLYFGFGRVAGHAFKDGLTLR